GHRTPLCPRGCRTRSRTSASQASGPRLGQYTNPPGREAGRSTSFCSPAVSPVAPHTPPAAQPPRATWSSSQDYLDRRRKCHLVLEARFTRGREPAFAGSRAARGVVRIHHWLARL